MERRWLWLCDCAAMVLARRELGEDDARQWVKVILLDYGSRMHVWIRQRNEYGQLVIVFRNHVPDFRSLRVEIWPMSAVTAEPYGRIDCLEIDRADFVALLDELCPEKLPQKSVSAAQHAGKPRIKEEQLTDFLLRPDVCQLPLNDQWEKAVAHFGRNKLTTRLFDSACPDKRPRGRKKMAQE
jgi:hypothetical protein